MIFLLCNENCFHFFLWICIFFLHWILVFFLNRFSNLAIFSICLFLYNADVVLQTLKLFISPFFLFFLSFFSIQKSIWIHVEEVRSHIIRPPMKSQRPEQRIIDAMTLEVLVLLQQRNFQAYLLGVSHAYILMILKDMLSILLYLFL